MTAMQQRDSHEATSTNPSRATRFAGLAAPAFRRFGIPIDISSLPRIPALLFLLAFVLLARPASAVTAPQFEPIADLNFSATEGSGNPLSQVIAVTSNGSAISFSATATVNSGGSWLTINPSNFGFGVSTPYAITVNVAPAVTLAAGSYSGQISIKPGTSGVTPIVVNVNLVVHATSETYFDQIAGGLTFSMATSGNAPPAQALQVRNAGAGSLGWAAAVSTSDGGSWLGISSSSGTAPSNLSVSVTPANLPGKGLTAGTFTGQVLFTYTVSSTVLDSVSVPVTINVGTSVLAQVNPINFNKVFAGANPLSQVITIANTGTTSVTILGSVLGATGGSWLTISPSNYGFGQGTPFAITLNVNPLVTLPAGTYMAEVIVAGNTNSQILSIPVTLTVNEATGPWFDNVAGALNFSMLTGGGVPPAQDIQIRNAGTGSLDWTSTVTTADGGTWLSISAGSGASPSNVTVTVNPANLPGAGAVAGTFVGQVALASSASRTTVPISITVSGGTFEQVNPLNFTKVAGGPNPMPQTITVASSGTAVNFNASVINGTGGSWLNITPSNYGFGQATPTTITASVNPSVTLAAGSYSAEVVVSELNGSDLPAQVMTIPVTLTIQPATATFFDALPGQMTFSMAVKGNPPPSQILPIRNAGQGTLDWTAEVSTTDGGDWLSISTDNGTAPSEPTVTVNPANLPGDGLEAGTFTGLIALNADGQQVTIPVSMTVGANVFTQTNPLVFTMVQGGANPLSQVVTIDSTGTTAGSSLNFNAVAYTSTGGSNWLSISPSNYGFGQGTPYGIVVSVTAPPTLAAGTYSGEIVFGDITGSGIPFYSQAMTVPVTLIVEPPTATYFDSTPGQLTFSMATMGSAPPPLALEIRNAGKGTLAWNSTLSTSDGGSWLSITSSSGTAPSAPLVSIDPTKLPGEGLLAGTFTGQILLSTQGDEVTVPIVVTVGANVFRQVNGLDFNMVAGGHNPLPQLINVPGTGTSVGFLGTISTSSGGNWLQINPTTSQFGFGLGTPQQFIVSATPVVTLGAGSYTGEIIFNAGAGKPDMVIPVTLTINPPTSTFFADMPGGVDFFMTPSGSTPAAQSIPIRNGGTGPGLLTWTATASTSDGGNWLKLSATTGTTPDSLSVSVVPANFPGEGLLAGVFNGMIVLTAGTSRQTVPVSVVVGPNTFITPAPLTFSQPFTGPNPGAKPLILTENGSGVSVFGSAYSSADGSWLSINPSNFGFGINLPTTVSVTAAPAAGTPVGTYIGEVIFTAGARDQGMVVPVTLNIVSVPAATPVISRKSGFYVGVQTVTLSDATKGATIYYSLGGKTPSSGSTLYKAGSAITIPVSEKIEAVAYATGYLPSAVASASYTIIANPPKISPAGGAFTSQATVTMSDVMKGAEIYFTINGTKPSKSSTHYTKPLTVTKNETFVAVAFAPGVKESADTAPAKISIAAAKPKISKPSGTYTKPITVTITDPTKGAKIFYTVNGKTPTAKSTPYTKALVIKTNETLKAIALVPGGDVGPIATAAYKFKTSASAAAAETGKVETPDDDSGANRE